MYRWLFLTAFWLTLFRADGAAPQQPSSINIYNNSVERFFLIVIDNLCGKEVFNGWILAESAITVAACRNTSNHVYLTIVDAKGEEYRYEGFAGSTINIRHR